MRERDDINPIAMARALADSGQIRPARTLAEMAPRRVRCSACKRMISVAVALAGSVGTYCPDCYDVADDI